MEYLDPVGSCRSFVVTRGRLELRMRRQEFTGDERETVRRGIATVMAATDWLEAAVDHGDFTLDEQVTQLLKREWGDGPQEQDGRAAVGVNTSTWSAPHCWKPDRPGRTRSS